MLNKALTEDWKKKVKAIFQERKALSEAELETPKLDLPSGDEGDVDAPPVDDTAPEAPPEGLSGEEGEQEESPSITITADCLLALFEYFQADENGDEAGEDNLDIDGDEGMGAESIAGSQPEMSMPASGLGIGMESEGDDVMPEPVAATQPGEGTVDGGDDIAASDDTLTDVPPEEGSDELTPEQVVQKLIDLSADKQEGEPLDVDCLSAVFSPEEGSGEELGDGSDLATNTEEIPGEDDGSAPALPATTGKQSVGPLAEEDSSNVGHSGELERKHKALAALEARLKSISDESDKADVREDIAAVKSQIAKLKTKGITTAQGHKHSADAKATHKDDPSA
jgi:hypothetical protein